MKSNIDRACDPGAMQEVGRRTDAQQQSLANLEALKADRAELLAAQEEIERRRQADRKAAELKKEEQLEQYKRKASSLAFFDHEGNLEGDSSLTYKQGNSNSDSDSCNGDSTDPSCALPQGTLHAPSLQLTSQLGKAETKV